MNVSVIIPVYNSSAYLKKCLDSILDETIENLEVIVINDGSTDNSIDIINEYRDKFSNMIVIDKINQGPSRARNEALQVANGYYIFYLDSDDWLEKGALTKLYNEARECNADIVVGKAENHYENGKTELINKLFTDVDIKRQYLLNEVMPMCKLIKRDLILKSSLYFLEDRIFEDLATVPAYMLHTDNIKFSDIKVYNYFLRTGAETRKRDYSPKIQDLFVAIKNIKMLFENAGKADEYKDELEYLFIHHLLHNGSLRFFKYQSKYYKENIDIIISMMKENYPNWQQNKYFKQLDFKYRTVCKLFFKKHYLILRLVLKK